MATIKMTTKVAWTNLIVLHVTGATANTTFTVTLVSPGSVTFKHLYDSANRELVIIPDSPLKHDAKITIDAHHGLNNHGTKDINGFQSPDPGGGGLNGGGSNGSAARALNFLGEYPVLTSNVDLSDRNGGGFTSGSGSGSGGVSLARQAQVAIQSVLGRRVKKSDPGAFVQALTGAFDLRLVENHVEWTWRQPSSVATDADTTINGAQASLYSRAMEGLEKSMLLLDQLYVLDPTADKEDAEGYRTVVRAQFSEIVQQLGNVGGPPLQRVDLLFSQLLGQTIPTSSLITDPDLVAATTSSGSIGTLGAMRDIFGLKMQTSGGTPNPYINSIDDEADVTNYRTCTDYIIGVCISYLNNRKYFNGNGVPGIPQFLGTQLVLLRRQLQVVADSVDDARSALASVYIGEDEVATIEFKTPPPLGTTGSTMLLGDLFNWITTAVTDGFQLIDQGGKIAVRTSYAPTLWQLYQLALYAQKPANLVNAPNAYNSPRTQPRCWICRSN